MKFTINRWGVGLEIGALIINLFIGDLYIKIPRVGECAYNAVGLTSNGCNSKVLKGGDDV